MNINAFINRFFGRDEAESSKNKAKERLRLVLVHDRLDVSEQMMNDLRVDLINVIGKYFGIDENALEVSLSRETEGMALVANIPIRRQNVSTMSPAEPPPSPKQEAKTTLPKQGAKATPPKLGDSKPAREKGSEFKQSLPQSSTLKTK